MLINTIYLDLNNVGENYTAFAKLLPNVIAAVSDSILHHFKLKNKAIDFDALTREYQSVTSNAHFHHYPSFWQHITERIIGRNLSYSEIETIYDLYLSEYKKNIRIYDDYIPLILLGIENRLDSTGAGILSNLDHLPEKFFYSHGNIILSSYAISKIVKSAHLGQNHSTFLITKNPIAKTHPIFNYKNNE